MPGHPTECRQNAAGCLLLAECAATEEARREFIALAETWIRLAAELEADQMLFQAMSELEFGSPSQTGEAYEVLPQVLRINPWAP